MLLGFFKNNRGAQKQIGLNTFVLPQSLLFIYIITPFGLDCVYMHRNIPIWIIIWSSYVSLM